MHRPRRHNGKKVSGRKRVSVRERGRFRTQGSDGKPHRKYISRVEAIHILHMLWLCLTRVDPLSDANLSDLDPWMIFRRQYQISQNARTFLFRAQSMRTTKKRPSETTSRTSRPQCCAVPRKQIQFPVSIALRAMHEQLNLWRRWTLIAMRIRCGPSRGSVPFH